MELFTTLLQTPSSALRSTQLKTFLPSIDVNELRTCVAAQKFQCRPEINVYGRKCKQPRDVVFVSDDSVGYDYSRQHMPSVPLDVPLRSLLNAVNATLGSSYNGILINRYRDGRDCIGAHRDDERGIDASAGVLSLSLGATRTFRLRQTSGPSDMPRSGPPDMPQSKVLPTVHETVTCRSRSQFDVKLRDLQMVAMTGAFQREFTHEVPREAGILGVRYDLTFRRHER